MKKALGQMALVLFTGLAIGASMAAEQNAAALGNIYKCHTATGGNAFVSKPDPSLTDCVKVSDYVASPTEEKSLKPDPGTQKMTHIETQDEHDARMKQMVEQVTKWCADMVQKRYQKQKERDKERDLCVVDHMGTYNLLYP